VFQGIIPKGGNFMKKLIGIVTMTLLCLSLFCACEAESAPASKASANVPTAEEKAVPTAQPQKTDDDLGWDGEWTGGGVTVTIKGAKTGSPDVKFVDEEMHSSLDEVLIDGNTLTGVYRITLEMYPEDSENLPEQEWTITMVKSGGTASYSRTTVLTWFNLNEDGTYGHTITKDNSASLTKTVTSSN